MPSDAFDPEEREAMIRTLGLLADLALIFSTQSERLAEEQRQLKRPPIGIPISEAWRRAS